MWPNCELLRSVFGKWLEMTNDSNDKWQMTCHFIAQMTNDPSHLNVMLASPYSSGLYYACFTFFIFRLESHDKISTNQNKRTAFILLMVIYLTGTFHWQFGWHYFTETLKITMTLNPRRISVKFISNLRQNDFNVESTELRCH